MAAIVTNWAGNLAFHASDVYRPASVEELRVLVARSPSVRAIGSGHSFSDVVDTRGALVSLDALPRTVELDGSTVRVGGAVRYAELAPRLHQAGFALRNLASLPHITVAGSVATATHGSGDGNGNLATAVRAMELVTAEGDLVTLTADDPRLSGAVVGLGALGVAVSLTLELVPAFEVRQYVFEDLPLEVLDDHVDEVFGSGYSVSLFTGWRRPVVDQVWVKRVSDEAPDLFGARPADGPRHPIPGASPEPCTEQLGVPGPWHERLPHFRPEFTPSAGQELQSEFLLPRRHTVAALRALHGIRAVLAPVLQISEIRTVAADDLWLSPAYGQDVAGFHFTWIKDVSRVLPVIETVTRALEPYEARPHWGKLFTAVAPYARMADFRELVGAFDPQGKFANDFLRRVM
ncbi:alditol oxidase [Nonomuraea africana]|uniref:Xylitol oxidase n=1 Tax=Nonomuraea africana TaxID=46171 RepID=A0ABR9KUX0_9ACTN|nr:FAD-binding protein [Nonomuraea africana]MBE1565820.1 xylitol oxidase [Nonomuraea africana]